MKVAAGSTFECSKSKRYELMCMTFFSFQIATVTIPFPVFRKSLGDLFIPNRQFVRNTVREAVCN